jgi:tetratricopeptide (TPR) repeat protein
MVISDESYKSQSIKNTILFNLGCLLEEMCRFGEANDIFKQIINENPYYVDAQLRMGYLQFKRGSLVKALETLEKAISTVENSKLRPDLVQTLT